MSRLKPLRIAAVVVVCVSLLTFAWAATVESGFGRSVPGPVIALAPVTGRGVTDSTSQGSFEMMTVKTEQLTWMETLQAISHGEELVALDEGSSIVDGFREMAAAKQTASALASWLADGVAPQVDGVLVAAVQPSSPAARAGLQGGDVIVAVDGRRPDTATEVIDLIKSGADLMLKVHRQDEAATFDVRLAPNGHAGLVLAPQMVGPTVDSFDVDTGAVQGPSAGMMLTLAFLDAATEGDLSAGLRVAGTGTIDADGTVGDVGGLREKLAAAADAGVDVFFIPASQQTLSGFTDMPTVPVDTVFEAVSWLCSHGGTAEGVCDVPFPTFDPAATA